VCDVLAVIVTCRDVILSALDSLRGWDALLTWRALQVLRMSLTVNQKTKTVDQAARSRRDFLEQLASSRAWDFRHWAKSSGLADRLHSLIEELAVSLHEEVAAAPAQTLKSNAGFEEVFGKLFSATDAAGVRVAELLWKDGEEARAIVGQEEEVLRLMRKAIDARGDKVLCQDDEAGRKRVVEMRRMLVSMPGSQSLQDDQQYNFALDKMQLGGSLKEAGDYEGALKEYEEAQKVFVALYGYEHPDVANTLQNTGIVYHKQGKIAEAKELFARAYKIRLEKLGPDHPETLKLKPLV